MIRMIKRLIVPLVLLAAACSPASDEQATNEQDTQAAQSPPAATPSMEGEWQVTAIDGQPLTQIFTMTAVVTGESFSIRSDCVRLNWEFSQTGPAVSLTSPSTVECPRGRTGDETHVERVISGVNMALFPGDGDSVQLSGHHGTLTMERS
jgi:hypothetical protein